MTTYTINLRHPRNGFERDLMREVALISGDGYTQGKAGVVMHCVSEHGLDRIEIELGTAIHSVRRDQLKTLAGCLRA